MALSFRSVRNYILDKHNMFIFMQSATPLAVILTISRSQRMSRRTGAPPTIARHLTNCRSNGHYPPTTSQL